MGNPLLGRCRVVSEEYEGGPGYKKMFVGEARIGKVMKPLASITLRPEDFSSPISLHMAITRIYESIIKAMEERGPTSTYIAEVKFTDDMGNNVAVAVDLGESLPPFSKDKVKARVIVEIVEED